MTFRLSAWITCLVLIGLALPLRAQDVTLQARVDVDTLASPAMQGRGYAFGGAARAATYLRERFEQIGLVPPDSGYLQPFPLVADVFPEAPALVGDGDTLRLGEDFLPYPGSAAGSAEAVERVADLGHGLFVPSKGINDYAGRDLSGAVLVWEAKVPDSLRADPDLAPYLAKEARLEIAALLGARAVVIQVDELLFGAGLYNAKLPVFEVKRSAWPASARQVSFEVESASDQPFTASNVVGMVPGTAQPDSTILVTAHYDHLGALGDDFYFPGANDNASGVALLLALAQHIQQHPLPYTTVFVAFSGEEQGLVGSQHFVEHPPIDLSCTRFMLNFDMVASGEDGLVAVGGTDFPDDYALLDSLNASLGDVALRPRANAPNSDHYPFLADGVRGFYLYTNRGTQPYHHAADRPATLEWDDFLHVYQLAKAFLAAL